MGPSLLSSMYLLAGAPQRAGGWKGAQFNTGPYREPIENYNFEKHVFFMLEKTKK